MRMVIDRNVLESPELDAYFAQSKKNTVVMTEFFCMETYKGDPFENIYRSTRVIAKNPKRFAVLRPATQLVNMDLLQPLHHQMIDQQQSARSWGSFVRT